MLLDVRSPCGCIGIDFTISMEFGIISFVMFSTNTMYVIVLVMSKIISSFID